jgi:hypothetical protein
MMLLMNLKQLLLATESGASPDRLALFITSNMANPWPKKMTEFVYEGREQILLHVTAEPAARMLQPVFIAAR